MAKGGSSFIARLYVVHHVGPVHQLHQRRRRTAPNGCSIAAHPLDEQPTAIGRDSPWGAFLQAVQHVIMSGMSGKK